MEPRTIRKSGAGWNCKKVHQPKIERSAFGPPFWFGLIGRRGANTLRSGLLYVVSHAYHSRPNNENGDEAQHLHGHPKGTLTLLDTAMIAAVSAPPGPVARQAVRESTPHMRAIRRAIHQHTAIRAKRHARTRGNPAPICSRREITDPKIAKVTVLPKGAQATGENPRSSLLRSYHARRPMGNRPLLQTQSLTRLESPAAARSGVEASLVKNTPLF
ncbi:MAG: hypothetical protein JWO80_5086 [Bryobacterales bacterium]|nr:hypothetical protein [Bryobacterales bacterium]